MKKKKVTAGMLTASMLAPMAVQFVPVTAVAVDADGRENATQVVYYDQRDCTTNVRMTQGLSLTIQNQGGGMYKHCGVKIYKLPDSVTIEGSKNSCKIDGKAANEYDVSGLDLVTNFHTIDFDDGIWVDNAGNVLDYDQDFRTGEPTFRALDAGKYIIVYDGDMEGWVEGTGFGGLGGILGGGDSSSTDSSKYTKVAFEVPVNDKVALDLEESNKSAVKMDKGNIQIQAVVVETDDNGNIIKDADGNFILTGEKVPDVKVSTEVKFDLLGQSQTLEMITDKDGLNTVENIPISPITALNPIFAAVLEYPDQWELADPDNDREFTFDLKAGETAVHVIELYKIPEGDDDNPDNPTEVPQALRVIVVDKETGNEVEGAGFSVIAKKNPLFKFEGTSQNGGVDKTSVLADTYTGSITSVPNGYKLNTDEVSVTLVPVTEAGVVTEIRLEIEKGVAVGALKAIVRDKDTKEPIPGAKVQVVDPAGNIIETAITDEHGAITKGDLTAGDYTIKVIEAPEEYKELPPDQIATVEVNKVAQNIFELEKGKGTLDVIVRDKDTKDPIPGATVVIKDKDGNIIDTIITGDDGKVHKPDLPEGDYVVEVVEVPDGYTPPEPQDVTIEKDKTSELIFEVEKGVGDLDVIVRDKDTKEPIPGATVQIVDKDGTVIDTVVTDANGKIHKPNLPVGDYTIKVTEVPEGYAPPADQTATIKKNETTEKIFEVEKGVGTLDVIVRDKDTKDPIPGATVQIVDKNGKVIDTVITDANGKIHKPNLPVGDYIVKVTKVPDGYTTPTDQTATIKKNETTEKIFELEKGVGTLDVTVRDKNTKDPIPGAKVQIVDKKGNVIDTIITDENGRIHKPNLPIGDYVVKVIEVPEGYTPPDNQNATIKKNETTQKIFELDKEKGALEVIVRDKETKEPIPGATVQVIDKNGKVIANIVTDKDGKVNKGDLPEGDYTVKVTRVPDGYNIPDDQIATIKKGETTQKIFELEKAKGNLEVIVRDKDTKEPIPGATVEIVDKDGKVIDTIVTDENGQIKKPNLPIGDYVIKVTKVPEGYNPPADQNATIKRGETTQKIFEVEKGLGALSVLVRDKDTKEPIPGAKVQIVDKNGKVILETKTNNEGKLEKDKLPAGDYTIKVIEVPEGYTTPANTVAPVKVGKKTNVIFELEKGRGNLEVTIRDKDTKEPIPGALVQVVDKNGTLITELRTDNNGQIKKENLPLGDYTIKVKEVPEGYTVPSDEKATVKKNETAKVLIELEKTIGALEVIVRDKNTKEPIPGAKVQVIDKDGKVILETVTDKNGRIEKDKLPIGDYTIKVKEVPSGYTLPNDQKITIKKSVKTTVIFELEKNKVPTAGIVQTGDNNNILGFIGAGLASIAGMIFVSRKNKKDD